MAPAIIDMRPLDPTAKCFFEFSPELRNMIYDFYFDDLRRSRQLRAQAAERKRHRAGIKESDVENSDDEEVDDAGPGDDENDQNDEEEPESDDPDCDGDGYEEEDDGDSESDNKNYADVTVPIELRRRPILGSDDWGHDMILDNVSSSKYPDEIVINQRADLQSRLPRLSCASRHLLSETWSYTYDRKYKFLIHVNHYNIRRIFESQRILQTLANTCGIVAVTEADTTIVLHGDESAVKKRSARQQSHQPQVVAPEVLPATPTSAKSWGYANLHPIYQRKAEYQKKCFGILKYLRILKDSSFAEWRSLAFYFVNGLSGLRRERQRDLRRLSKSSVVKWSEVDLVELEDWNGAVLEAVVAVIGEGAPYYLKHWEREISNLARKVFRNARNAAIRVLGNDFEAIEKTHSEMALPQST